MAKRGSDIQPGEFYEDSAHHPCVCVGVSEHNDEIWGISLIDGSQPRSCSLNHSGVRKLTIAEVQEWKDKGPPEVRNDPKFPREKKWWR